MADEKAPAAEPTTADKLNALADAVCKMGERMDSFMSKQERKDAEDNDDDGDDKKPDREAKKDAEKEEEDPPKVDVKKDAAEGEDEPEAKKDASKKDADEDKGEPEPMASDDDRKDQKADADARADAAVMRRQIAELERKLERSTRTRSDDEMNDLGESQTEWDRVAQAHGLRAARTLDGESRVSYDRRVAKTYQQHSPKWKAIDLSALPKQVLDIAVPEIRADALSAAYRPSPTAIGGMQREIVRSDDTGRRIREFVGPVGAMNGTLAPFRMPSMRVSRINNNPNQY